MTTASSLDSNPSTARAEQGKARIFISYRHNSEPDVTVAEAVCRSLKQRYDVFIDRDLEVGARWAERIEEELRRSDLMIVFLSASSVHSEMVRGEVEKCHDLAKEQGGRPRILPVRLAYREPFASPLSAWLNPINWAFWDRPEDTLRLIEELSRAVQGHELAVQSREERDGMLSAAEPPALPQPLPSAVAAGDRRSADARFYVERSLDAVALSCIRDPGVTLTIKAPRQMGKSSLLARAVEAAKRAGKRVAALDFQLLDRSALKDSDRFFRLFCSWLTDELEMEDRVDHYWRVPLSNPILCTRYMERHILKQMEGRSLVLAMDEVDNVLDAEFRTDFFGMLRSWHGARNAEVPTIWNQLDLALVISTEPYQLIDSLNQSPFNVGEVVELEDFTPAQVADLNRRHASPLDAGQEAVLMQLLHGHPFLTRRALYLVAGGRFAARDLLQRDAQGQFTLAAEGKGPFGDHLRYHLFRLYDQGDGSETARRRQAQLVESFRTVIGKQRCPDKLTLFRLRGAGLVREGEDDQVLPRCQLYEDYFREQLGV
ncbi:MAG TPA: AAA-like domain-containing protein [Thermoanaerobaculia bacterium]|nr:AAA-like domain-containing protein [Thermoanaerobaculia bacterium]